MTPTPVALGLALVRFVDRHIPTSRIQKYNPVVRSHARSSIILSCFQKSLWSACLVSVSLVIVSVNLHHVSSGPRGGYSRCFFIAHAEVTRHW